MLPIDGELVPIYFKRQTGKKGSVDKMDIGKIKDNEIVLVLSCADDSKKNNLGILKYLAEKSRVVAVAASQPYEQFNGALGKDSENVFFIDCITRNGWASVRKGNCIFIDNTSGLTEIGIAITEGLSALPQGQKYLFIDSVSGISKGANKDVFPKFAQFLASKTREHGASGVFVSISGAMDAKMLSSLEQFCDRKVDLSKGKEGDL